ncbi:hypothetical protein X801_02328, partial [Opisthorchis viverrini]
MQCCKMNVIPKGLSDFNGASTAWACATRGWCTGIPQFVVLLLDKHILALSVANQGYQTCRSQAKHVKNNTYFKLGRKCVEEFTEFILTSFYSAQRSSCVAAISLLNPKQINCFDIACSLEGGDHGPLDTSANISIQRLDGGQNAFV